MLVVLTAIVISSAAACAASLSLLPPALGVSGFYATDRVSGTALAGLDPVSYILEPKPRPGMRSHEVLYAGLVWRFASEANRAAFELSPDTFIPRLGGYDALHVASGVVVSADPNVFLAVSGRIYLFRNAANRDSFLADDGTAERAEGNWPAMLTELVRG